jgi:hypothetical protein
MMEAVPPRLALQFAVPPFPVCADDDERASGYRRLPMTAECLGRLGRLSVCEAIDRRDEDADRSVSVVGDHHRDSVSRW